MTSLIEDFKKEKKRKEFEKELFDELLRFYLEKTTGQKFERYPTWRHYINDQTILGEVSSFGESPYEEILENFVLWLIKEGYNTELVSDYFGCYTDKVTKLISSKEEKQNYEKEEI